MREPRWLKRRVLEIIHADNLARYGGSSGIRAGGDQLIESALARPKHRFTYEPDATLADLAAAYLYGLAKNHGYIDGNKRIAFSAAVAFLRSNGVALSADHEEAYERVVGLVEDRYSESEVAAWIQLRSTPLNPG
jgi:death-on-curing protein